MQPCMSIETGTNQCTSVVSSQRKSHHERRGLESYERMLHLTVPVVVIFLSISVTGTKTSDVLEVDGMYALARW